MIENTKSEAISRRKIFSLLGLAAAFSFAAPAAVLSLLDDAEAQTTTTTAGTRGQQRRAARTDRRQDRRTGRTERRAIRRGTAPAPQ
jgi:hypothetical protein